jgi:hypothetical protein
MAVFEAIGLCPTSNLVLEDAEGASKASMALEAAAVSIRPSRAHRNSERASERNIRARSLEGLPS